MRPDRIAVLAARSAAEDAGFEIDVDGFGQLLESPSHAQVLIGEAPHGTDEFYRARAELTRFDAVMHIDETQALEPLEPWSLDELDLPESYPSAL